MLSRITLIQRNTINSPAAGLQIWCTDCNSNGEFQVFNVLLLTNSLGSSANLTVPGSPTNVQVVQTGNSQVSFLLPLQFLMEEVVQRTIRLRLGGNLRDSYTTPVPVTTNLPLNYGTELNNWCVHFIKDLN